MIRLFVLLVCFIATSAHADTDVRLDISGINKSEAQIVASVYSSKKTWLKDPVLTEVAVLSTDTADGTATINVSLPPGDYAFHIYHDLDMNGEMKTNFIGIPKEPTGVSNNAKGKFGPPKFKDAMITVGTDPISVALALTEI